MGTTFNNLWYPTTLKIKKNKIPFFKFADADVLNIYIPLQKYTGFIKDIKVNITVGNSILSDSNIKNLYKSGFDFLKSIGSSKKEFVVTYQLNPKEVEVLYFAQKYNKKNAHIIKVKMFDDKDFLVSYSNSLNGKGGKFSVDFSPISNVNYRKFTHYEIDFYGLAKRYGKSRGSRLIR
ncbi:MAG: hypothetical protein COA50_00865 [Flavobacteriaceae bacterium]|nr:MAG: hypothetical protein COA50_00865 [Flavobacteriaceae bacterium]